ncbi:phospholipase A and acyltransferase 3-like [Engraulis encrasicolus]|uniref:phospholipase A and acyltransferase 3-like n=1 Tax=Engraulis encrasicolus TaxID=184585 RepID=UPI002FD059FE
MIEDPKPGDMIEILNNIYSHWAIYTGDGMVVHVTVPGTQFKPLPVATILKEAADWVDKEFDYNLLLDNCEHFATQLRYGHPESRQVRRGLCVCATCTVCCVELVKWIKRHHPRYTHTQEKKALQIV